MYWLILTAVWSLSLPFQTRAADAVDVRPGETVLMVQSPRDPSVRFETTLYWPSGTVADDAPLVLINHGTRARGAQPRYRPLSPAKFFNELGWPVVVPNRRGYGNSTGARVGLSSCDLKAYGLENAKDVEDVVVWLSTQPQLKSRKLIVIGQSTGGVATMAYSSLASNQAAAILNFHGGMRPTQQQCLWQARVDAFADYARTSKPASLWVYTANDHSSNQPYIAKLHQAFTAAGGKAALAQLPAFEDDGHYLFGRPDGEAIWQPLVRKYLQEMNLLPDRGH
jgi:dienelactone hydrolase